MNFRQIYHIARGVWLEAYRRKEIYVIVGLCCLFIIALAQFRFFGLENISKFYRETALKIMSAATALTVMVLGTRQLPREFETRTIYPLLARPITRGTFLLGKQVGVVLAGCFCLGLFLLLYGAGSWMMGAPLYPVLLLQHTLLQVCMVLILTSLCFLLSLLCSPDAALTLALLYYAASTMVANLFLMLYDYSEGLARLLISAFTWILPQMMLFDLSEKNVHGDVWEPLSFAIIGQLAGYALVFTAVYLLLTWWVFRRRAL